MWYGGVEEGELGMGWLEWEGEEEVRLQMEELGSLSENGG